MESESGVVASSWGTENEVEDEEGHLQLRV